MLIVTQGKEVAHVLESNGIVHFPDPFTTGFGWDPRGVCACMRAFVHACVCKCVCVYEHVCVSACLCVYVCACTCMCACWCVVDSVVAYTCAGVQVCIHVNVFVLRIFMSI